MVSLIDRDTAAYTTKGKHMAFYRYSATYYTGAKDGPTIRSLVPFSLENEKNQYYCHRYYTHDEDDAQYCYVVSLGHEMGSPCHVMGPRAINRFIIHYVMNGHGYYNDKEVHAGQIFITHPYAEHTIRHSSDAPLEFYYIGISGTGTEELMKRTGFFTLPDVIDFSFAERIPPIFYDALYCTHPNTDIELYLLGVFYKLMALHKEENANTLAGFAKLDSYAYYKAARKFIDDYLLDGITPNDVATHLHISPSYLRAIFSKYCKYSLRELLIRRRIECAASRLTYDNYSVTEAAALVGYEDYTLFSKLFKKYTGVSPQVYKKQHCNIPVVAEDINREADDVK